MTNKFYCIINLSNDAVEQIKNRKYKISHYASVWKIVDLVCKCNCPIVEKSQYAWICGILLDMKIFIKIIGKYYSYD